MFVDNTFLLVFFYQFVVSSTRLVVRLRPSQNNTNMYLGLIEEENWVRLESHSVCKHDTGFSFHTLLVRRDSVLAVKPAFPQL